MTTTEQRGTDHLAALVVVNYGSSALLADNLTAVPAREGLEVIVVDSFSTEAERAAVSAAASEHGWLLVPLPGNPGFGAAVNAGVARAREHGADVVVLLNPDAVVSSWVLDSLMTAARDAPDTLVCPRIETPAGDTWFAGGELFVDRGITRTRGIAFEQAEHPWLTGACLAFSMALWDRVGGFDDRYFMYWEDIDLSHRVRATGGRLVVRTDLVAVHAVGGTQQGEGKSDLYCRYNCRNRLLFAARHVSDADLRRWVRSSPRYAGEVLRRGGRRALLRSPAAPTLAAVRGTYEGLRWVIAERGVRSLLPGGRRAAP